MHKSFLKSFVLAVVTALAVMLTPSALAQVVTSGLAGTVRSNDGSPISGATVTAVFTPTNATFTSTTSATGRYQFGGLPVGGPYTITTSAAGYASEPTTGITTELGNTIDVNLSMKSVATNFSSLSTSDFMERFTSIVLPSSVVMPEMNS